MLDPGTQVGRYEIHRRLGRGGMGAVYVAHDPVLGRMVAIKVFSGELDLPEAHERFSREARSAAAISHPNIVTIHDYGEYASQPYIVMEYVPGETLGQMIRRKAPVSQLDKLRWMEELCAGVGHAHELSTIHRDIKPSNLIVDRSGRLKILDFGIARLMGTSSNTTGVVGTPGYMAPEQILDGPVDYRADLFSIGVVFYELLAYTEAFPGETIAAITHRIVTAEPAPLATVASDVQPEVIEIVERLLRKVPSDRFGDAASVRLAVSRIRRRLESDSHPYVAKTILRPPRISPLEGPKGETPPGGQLREATTPSNYPTAATTKTPGPRKTDREALARRREEQLRAALERSRSLLASNDLDGAYDACQQALTYDEQHPEALELEEAIQAAFAAPAVSPAVAADVEVVAATAPSLAAPSAAAPSELRAPVPALVDDSADLGATRLTPRRTPTPGAAAVPTAPTRPSPSPTPVQRFVAHVVERSKAARPAAQAVLVSVRSLPRRKVMLAAGVFAGAAAASVAFVMMAGGSAATGTLIVDAVPWGTVTSIRTEDGEGVDLPSPAATPIALPLPSGNYQVVVVGPPPESQEQRLTVRVDSGATRIAPPVKFHVVTPEQYFEPYLATSSGDTGSGAIEAANSPVSAPVSPADAPASTGLRP